MIIIKTANGDTFVNEKKTQLVKHDKERNEVTVYMEKSTPIVITEVTTIYYMPGRRKKKSLKEESDE